MMKWQTSLWRNLSNMNVIIDTWHLPGIGYSVIAVEWNVEFCEANSSIMACEETIKGEFIVIESINGFEDRLFCSVVSSSFLFQSILSAQKKFLWIQNTWSDNYKWGARNGDRSGLRSTTGKNGKIYLLGYSNFKNTNLIGNNIQKCHMRSADFCRT